MAGMISPTWSPHCWECRIWGWREWSLVTRLMLLWLGFCVGCESSGQLPEDQAAIARLQEKSQQIIDKAHASSPGLQLLACDASQLQTTQDEPRRWFYEKAPHHNILLAFGVLEDEEMVDMVGQRFDALNYVWGDSGGSRRLVNSWYSGRFQIRETVELSEDWEEAVDAGNSPLICYYQDRYTQTHFYVANTRLDASQTKFFSSWAELRKEPIVAFNSGTGDLSEHKHWTVVPFSETASVASDVNSKSPMGVAGDENGPAAGDQEPIRLQVAVANFPDHWTFQCKWLETPPPLSSQALHFSAESD